MPVHREYYLGLDLGQKQNHSAIVIVERFVEREERRNGISYAIEWHHLTEPRMVVRYLERMDLGTSYLDVVARVNKLVWSEALRGRTKLVVDATGAGGPVVDVFRRDKDLKRACDLVAVTITSAASGGVTRGAKRDEWLVPKHDLMTGLVLMLERKELQIARGMAETRLLVEELVKYGRDDSEQDDLALALALATWKARWDHDPDSRPVDGGDKVRRGLLTAMEHQQAAEFVGAIMSVSARRFRE